MATVLVVDDSKFARSQCVRALKQAGFAVLEATDGNEALQTVRCQGVDCIVTDLIMPVLDGASFIRKLRGAGIRAPVVVHTSDEQAQTRAALQSAGVIAVVSKSQGHAALVQAVNLATHAAGAAMATGGSTR